MRLNKGVHFDTIRGHVLRPGQVLHSGQEEIRLLIRHAAEELHEFILERHRVRQLVIGGGIALALSVCESLIAGTNLFDAVHTRGNASRKSFAARRELKISTRFSFCCSSLRRIFRRRFSLKVDTHQRYLKSKRSGQPGAISGRLRPRKVIRRRRAPDKHVRVGRSKKRTVSEEAKRTSIVPPKLPSIIHASCLQRDSSVDIHSTRGVSTQPGFQNLSLI